MMTFWNQIQKKNELLFEKQHANISYNEEY